MYRQRNTADLSARPDVISHRPPAPTPITGGLYRRLLMILCVLGFTAACQAGIVGEYGIDDYTLHVWHFNEAAGSSTIADGAVRSPLSLTVEGSATLGNQSFEGFGTALQSSNGAYASGGIQPLTAFTWSGGTFAFEAIIRPDVNPLSPPNHMNIICGERVGGDPRSWQFRITTSGQLNFIRLPSDGALENFVAPLPSSGPNAAVQGQWYHVAVTYTGESGEDNLKLFWTLLDESRTEANLLAEFTMNNALGGEPLFTVGTSGRNPAGEGFHGLVDEVRISDIDRYPNEMMFSGDGTEGFPPRFTVNPSDTLVGLGETLELRVVTSGTLPIAYQWQFNDEDLPGQTSDVLTIADVAFENEGSYAVIATNDYGQAVSDRAQVTVGALFSELFNTGVDDAGVLLGGGSVDPHYDLVECYDANNWGPDAIVWSDDYPVPVFVYNGPDSAWISSVANTSTVPGRYVYRTQFVIDSANPNASVIEGSWMLNTIGTDILLNGESTGITNTSELPYKVTEPFTITDGFVPGLNTLDFIVTNTGITPENLAASYTALRVVLRGVGAALPSGTPQRLKQPLSQTVRRNGKVTLSVVAQGIPPLSYQWLVDGDPVDSDDATSRTLGLSLLTNAEAGDYTVVVTNDSGAVASEPAHLTVVPDNQPPVAGSYSVTVTQDTSVDISVGRLLYNASDPDGDAVSLVVVDDASAQGGAIVDPGGAFFTYTPLSGFTGTDQIGYVIEDSQGAEADGLIEVQVLE